MSLPPTLPRRSWLERSSLALAVALLLFGTAAFAGWILNLDILVQVMGGVAPIRANTALCLVLLGAVLLLVELGWSKFAWAALMPAAIGLLSLVEQITQYDLGIDEFLARDYLLIGTEAPGRMAAIVAGSLFLASIVLSIRGLRGGGRTRIFAEAVTGSVVASVGFSTLLGYATSLPAVYSWGTNTATSPLDAIALLLLGLALLALAWRENLKIAGGPPNWSPMPAVIGCITLTVILWIGLRERELVYLGTNTKIAIQSLANNTSLALSHQAADVEHLAQSWSKTSDNATGIWEADAATHLRDAPGCISVAWVDPSFHTRWIYPAKGNESAFNYAHSSEPLRAGALAVARNRGIPVISPTIDVPLAGKGFAIYAPIKREGQIIGYVAAEYLYQRFFSAIDRILQLSVKYHTTVSIAGEVVFNSSDSSTFRDEEQSFDSIYPIADRRMRFSLTPSEDFLSRNRRSLPEFALLAGFGITVLLGLSVHLARTARAGLLSSDQSNKRLLAENEERRRIEARLKVSDERLRLALDSTQIGIFEWNVPAGHVYYSSGRCWAMNRPACPPPSRPGSRSSIPTIFRSSAAGPMPSWLA